MGCCPMIIRHEIGHEKSTLTHVYVCVCVCVCVCLCVCVCVYTIMNTYNYAVLWRVTCTAKQLNVALFSIGRHGCVFHVIVVMIIDMTTLIQKSFMRTWAIRGYDAV